MTSDRIYLLSDIHLNLLPQQKRKDLLKFVKNVIYKKAGVLLLNGDIVDLMEDQLDSGAKEDIKIFFDLLFDLGENGIPIHYLLGNHDIPLLLLFPGFQSQKFVDVHSNYPSVVISKNFTLHYRSYNFSYFGKKVYLEHGHIYDLGWVPGINWQNGWEKASHLSLEGDFVLNIYHLWETFHGCGEDYEVRILRTGSHLPALSYASREATRISQQGDYDWVFLGHFHSPVIEELGNGKVFANPGDSLQHGNYLILTPEGIRISDWREIYDED